MGNTNFPLEVTADVGGQAIPAVPTDWGHHGIPVGGL